MTTPQDPQNNPQSWGAPGQGAGQQPGGYPPPDPQQPGEYPTPPVDPQTGVPAAPGVYPAPEQPSEPLPPGPPSSAGFPSSAEPSTGFPPPAQASAAFPPQGPPAAGFPPPGQGGGGYPPPGAPAAGFPLGQPPAAGFPPPGQPAGDFPPPAPAPTPRRFNWIRLVIPLLVVAVAAGFWIYNKNTAAEEAKVGDCLEVKSISTVNADASQIDCGDPKATYTVTATGDGAVQCDEGEPSFELTAKGGDVRTKLCLRENLTVGECWNPGTSVIPPSKPACDSAKAGDDVYRVVAVDTTTSDETTCPAESIGAYAYPKRNVLICFAEVSHTG